MHIDQGWISTATVVASPNADLRPDEADVSLLVIHNISLPPGQFGGGHVTELFTNTLDPTSHPYFAEIADLKVSAHLLIDRQGAMTQFVPFHQRAWHAGVSEFEGRTACNDYSMGIELEGTDIESYTDQQYACLVQVTRCLMAEYPALTAKRIRGHSDIAPSRKTDPGPAFDWLRFTGLLLNKSSRHG
jgi:AmpD protein|tara:strand:+ start:1560 stop:2123 length:564 start_codon:yes stop_codon:yes gene_type:complete